MVPVYLIIKKSENLDLRYLVASDESEGDPNKGTLLIIWYLIMEEIQYILFGISMLWKIHQ